MDGWIVLFVFVAVAAVAAIVSLFYYLEKKRTEEMGLAAERLGFSFSAEPEPGLLEGLRSLRLFSQGRSRKIRSVLRHQVDDIQITLFDYRFTTSSGKHNRTHDQTVGLFETERLELPAFALRPEHVFHRLAGALGYQDIDFEQDPAFSEAVLLQGRDEHHIRSLFDRNLLAYFARHPGVCAEGEGSRLVFYRQERRVEPAQLEGFVEEGLDVLSAMLEAGGDVGVVPWLEFGSAAAQATREEPEVVWRD
jgi:hypothetical protein